MEERDRRWQEEKQEILAEVQRLKAEASRMVSILALEVIITRFKYCIFENLFILFYLAGRRTGTVIRRKKENSEARS